MIKFMLIHFVVVVYWERRFFLFINSRNANDFYVLLNIYSNIEDKVCRRLCDKLKERLFEKKPEKVHIRHVLLVHLFNLFPKRLKSSHIAKTVVLLCWSLLTTLNMI